MFMHSHYLVTSAAAVVQRVHSSTGGRHCFVRSCFMMIMSTGLPTISSEHMCCAGAQQVLALEEKRDAARAALQGGRPMPV